MEQAVPLPPFSLGPNPAGTIPNKPVAPPIAAPAPVNPAANASTPVMNSIVNTDPNQQINDAVASGNHVVLDSWAQRLKNTPEGQAAADLADRIKKGQAEAANLFQGVDPYSREGRMKALSTYQTVKDNPRYGSALMMYMAGDKLGAMQMVMGGKVTTKTEYLPFSGRAVNVARNDLGELVSVEDLASGQIIPKQEYGKLGGSVGSLESTLKNKSDVLTQEYRTKAFNQATEAHNNLATLANAKAPYNETMTNLLEEIFKNPQVNMEDRIKIAGVNSAQTSLAKSMSQSRQFLDSATTTKGNNISAEDRKALGLGAGPVSDEQLRSALKAHADYTLSDKAGNTYSAGTLLQLMDNKNIGTQFDRSYSQSKADLEEATLLNAYKDKPDLYAKIKMAFDMHKQLQKLNADAEAKYGNPLFTIPATATGFSDPVQKALAQSVQEKFNIKATQAFIQFRDQQMDLIRSKGQPDFVPAPGELEKAFTQSPQYKQMQRDASREIVDTISRKPVFKTETSIPVGGTNLPSSQQVVDQTIPLAVSPSALQNQREAAAEAAVPPPASSSNQPQQAEKFVSKLKTPQQVAQETMADKSIPDETKKSIINRYKDGYSSALEQEKKDFYRNQARSKFTTGVK